MGCILTRPLDLAERVNGAGSLLEATPRLCAEPITWPDPMSVDWLHGRWPGCALWNQRPPPERVSRRVDLVPLDRVPRQITHDATKQSEPNQTSWLEKASWSARLQRGQLRLAVLRLNCTIR